jgi:hypothetical protein
MSKKFKPRCERCYEARTLNAHGFCEFCVKSIEKSQTDGVVNIRYFESDDLNLLELFADLIDYLELEVVKHTDSYGNENFRIRKQVGENL